jgi:hypothetical protein
MNLLSRLKGAGELILHHDYRAGHYQDLSGNGNHGTPTSGVTLGKAGARIPGNSDWISVADSPELQLTALSIVVFFAEGFHNWRSRQDFVCKRDAGGTNYHVYSNTAGQLSCWDGDSSPDWNVDYLSSKSLIFTMTNGANGTLYLDGVSAGSSTTAIDVATDDAPLIIGNLYSGSRQVNQNTLSAVAIVNRILTPTEAAELHTDLAGTPDTRKIISTPSMGLVSLGNNARETTSNITAGWIPGTIWQVDSGEFAVEIETVDGKECKIIECKTNGNAYFKWSELRNNLNEAAYGTYEWWAWKTDAAINTYIPVAASTASYNDASQTGYLWSGGGVEQMRFYEITTGTITSICQTATGYETPDVWNKYKVTRSPVGEFTLYLNDVAWVAVSGSNPVTDNTNTQAEYFVWQARAGEKTAISTIDGQPLFNKWNGVA